MHDHTTKAVATLESEAPLIKAVDTLEAETILTKAVVATLEHVGTLDVMRVAIGEESNGAITRPGEDQVPTTGDTLDRDGGRDGVAETKTDNSLGGYTFDQGSLRAEAVTKPRTFTDACAHPSAKRVTVCGRTGPVNAIEADGVLFIEDDETEAKAEAIRAKAMEPASEVAAASKAAATAAASEVAVAAPAPEPAVATAALESEPFCAATSPAVVKSISYAAAVSRPSVAPKPSAAPPQSAAGPELSSTASKLSADLKRPSAASKPAAAVLAPLEEPDDVIVARRCSGKALEKTSRGDIIGFAGDTDGEVQASNKLGAYTVPTTFLNNTVEAKVAARKLGAQTATQEEQAKKAEFKPVQAATEPAAPKRPDTKQKIKKQAAAAKEDAPVRKPAERCTARFSARGLFVGAALIAMALWWSNSSGAEVTKSVTSWSGTPNGQQCGLHDNGDNGVRNEPSSMQDAFETTCPANTALGADKDMDMGPDDGASELSLKPSSLSTTRRRVRSVAVPPQYLPMLLAALPITVAPTISSAITCSSGLYPNEVGWSLNCSDGTTLGGGAPFTSSLPLAVELGATCTLSMTDSYGDGWNGAKCEAPGFGQSFSLASGAKQGTGSFVVQFQPPSPSSPPPRFDCTTKEPWSADQSTWCCANKQRGCAPPPPPSPSPPSLPMPPPPLPSPSLNALAGGARRLVVTTTFTTKDSLKTAVQAYNANPTAAIATYGLIADWDVSAVTDMSGLFNNLRNFNADVSSWNTSSVTTMRGMFGYASAFNQPLSLDTSSVTDMSHMFKVPRGPWPPTSWSNAPNDQQCGLYENGVPGDQQGVLCEIGARNEASATKEAFEGIGDNMNLGGNTSSTATSVPNGQFFAPTAGNLATPPVNSTQGAKLCATPPIHHSLFATH